MIPFDNPIKPAIIAVLTITTIEGVSVDLSAYLTFCASNLRVPSKFGASPYQLLLDHGVAYTAPTSPRPPGFEKMPDRECFANATDLVFDRRELIYVEGYATPDISINLPVHHAWVVTGAGKVIDPTWHKAGLAYLGIPFRLRYLAEALLEGEVFGLLHNPKWPEIGRHDPKDYLWRPD